MKIVRVAQIMGKMIAGGVESMIMNYYRNIDRSKIQFDFIIDSDSKCDYEDEILSLGGRVYRISPYQNIKKNMEDLERIFKKNKYKIVHSHLTTMSVFSLAVAKKCGIPVRICHGHSTSDGKINKKNIMKYILRPFAKTFSTHYFACSEYAGKWLFGEKAVEQGKVIIVKNAIDLEKFKFSQSNRNDVRKELGIEGKFVVGHIGRFVYEKNHEFLLDIFEEILKVKPDSVLLLIGEGPLEKQIKQKAKKFPKGTVKFLGKRTDAYRFYSAFDVFILPSTYEGFGIVVLEAQCSGVKVLCSNTLPISVKILDTLEFIDLKENAGIWANMSLKCNKRYKDAEILVEKAGFDITKQSILETFYLSV